MIKKFIYENWSYIMDHRISPLKNIKDNNVRFMILQLLAWMWSITFSLWFGSFWIFGFTAIAHILVLTVIMITVLTFEHTQYREEMILTFCSSRQRTFQVAQSV